MEWFRKAWHPDRFQGEGRKKRYFEGWYFKNVSQNGQSIFSFIPGIALGNSEKEAHAFIQVIDGISSKTDYYLFPLDQFRASKDSFQVEIGGNLFSEKGFAVDLAGEIFQIKGSLDFSETVLFPSRLLSPGIMGWFSFVPFMECYHGVVSMDHRISGSLNVNQKEIDFSQGRGYIEKDWGRSFPSSWIWMQTNHFEKPGDSFMFSLARVPWMGQSFPGFTGFIRYNRRLKLFATYTGAKLDSLEWDDHSVHLSLSDKESVLDIHAERAGLGILQAPVNGVMDRRIPESITARLRLLLKDRKGNLLFEGQGKHAGLEMVGDMSELKPSL